MITNRKDHIIDKITYKTWVNCDNEFLIRMSEEDRGKQFKLNPLFSENQVFSLIRQMESKVFSKIKR